MDPLRSEVQPVEALTGAERDARIEQLLLSGLDQYFAGHYEQAINLWTRVLFLDRHHGRARAYIERARSAQAERQRESEAVLHEGIEAFHEGDVARAQQLVADALHRGASPDEAQGMLGRIERLGTGQRAPKPQRTAPSRVIDESGLTLTTSGRDRHVTGWIAALLLASAAFGVLAVGAWGVALPEPSTWAIFDSTGSVEPLIVVPLTPEPVPVPGATETFLSRSRAHFANGRVHDALRELDRIPIGDRLRPEADRLRAEVQRQLLAVAAAEGARPSTSSAPPSTRSPE